MNKTTLILKSVPFFFVICLCLYTTSSSAVSNLSCVPGINKTPEQMTRCIKPASLMLNRITVNNHLSSTPIFSIGPKSDSVQSIAINKSVISWFLSYHLNPVAPTSLCRMTDMVRFVPGRITSIEMGTCNMATKIQSVENDQFVRSHSLNI